MKFNYENDIVKRFKKQGLFNTLAIVIVLIASGVIFSNWFSNLSHYEANKFASNPISIILIVAATFVIVAYFGKRAEKALKIAQCLEKNYIEITQDKLNGMVCENLKSKDSVRYFSIYPNEILKVEKQPSDSVYTVFIYTKNETLHLCVENADFAISQISNFAFNKVTNQVYECPKCAQSVYWGQEKCTCGQNFDWTQL